MRDIAPAIAVRPRFCGGRSFEFGISLTFYLNRNQLFASCFENNTRQWARRRPLQNGAILDREETFVARAFKPVFRLRIIDRARKMSAFLAVAYIFVLGGADQDAMVLFCWIAEKFHSPNRNLSALGHWLLRVNGGSCRKPSESESTCCPRTCRGWSGRGIW